MNHSLAPVAPVVVGSPQACTLMLLTGIGLVPSVGVKIISIVLTPGVVSSKTNLPCRCIVMHDIWNIQSNHGDNRKEQYQHTLGLLGSTTSLITVPSGRLRTTVTFFTLSGAFTTTSMIVLGSGTSMMTLGSGLVGVGVNTNCPLLGLPSVTSGSLVTVVSSLSSSLSTWQIVPLVVAPLTPGVVPLKPSQRETINDNPCNSFNEIFIHLHNKTY